MPPWVAFAPRLTSLTKGRAIERLPPLLRCRDATPRSLNLNLRRSASTHVSPTAINLRPNIPPRNKELYDALSALSGAAETYVNISRLQLALSGLAAQDAVTRVAGRCCAWRLLDKADSKDSTRSEQSSQRPTTCAPTSRGSIGQRGGLGEGAGESWRWKPEGYPVEVSASFQMSRRKKC